MDEYREIVRFYDAENQDLTEDLALYGELLDETGGPVLDVGCGTGRVAFHLAQMQAARVVGLDISGAMLERARARLQQRHTLAGQVEFLEADITTFESDERFGLVVFAYNGFMHLRRQSDQLAALRRMAAALRDDGRLVIDLPNAARAYAAPDEIGLVFERTFTDSQTGSTVMQHSISQIERTRQMLVVTWVYDVIEPDGAVKRFLAPEERRYTFAAEMDLLLAQSGLERTRLYGDYDRAPFVDGAPRMIVVACRRDG
ncbi:MAG: class I SAM-dependent methyltransferase [Anaerolineae bacterium]|nr:class I SAM-dependent methyltransferase [Anaerolineae bacterium]